MAEFFPIILKAIAAGAVLGLVFMAAIMGMTTVLFIIAWLNSMIEEGLALLIEKIGKKN